MAAALNQIHLHLASSSKNEIKTAEERLLQVLSLHSPDPTSAAQ